MEQDAQKPDAGGHSAWLLAVLLVLAAVTLWVVQLRRPQSADPLVGKPLPSLEAAGWLNTDRPVTVDDLRGKIVVLDFWASWCGPCARSLPHLVEYRQRYRDRGVMVVGLTREPASDLERIKGFLGRVEGVDWPNAYGAWMAVDQLGIEGWPTYMLYDRSGKSVWSGWSVDDLEDATVELLAKE